MMGVVLTGLSSMPARCAPRDARRACAGTRLDGVMTLRTSRRQVQRFECHRHRSRYRHLMVNVQRAVLSDAAKDLGLEANVGPDDLRTSTCSARLASDKSMSPSPAGAVPSHRRSGG